MELFVSPLSHEYPYGVFPPIAATEILPLSKPQLDVETVGLNEIVGMVLMLIVLSFSHALSSIILMI